MIYLTLPELVYIAERATGGRVVIRDAGLLEAAAARPRATAFGADAYPDLDTKAAALLHSLARNHALVDGNKRLAFMAMMGFLLKNGIAFDPEPAQSTTIILSLAAGEVSEESLTRWIRDNWPPEPGQ